MAAQIEQPLGRVTLGILDINLPSPVTSSSAKHSSYSPNIASTQKPIEEAGRPTLPLSPSVSPVQKPEGSPLSGTKRKLGMLSEEFENGLGNKSIKHNASNGIVIHEDVDSREEGEMSTEVQGEEGFIDGTRPESRHVLERDSDRSSEGTPRESPSPSSTFDTTQDTQNTALTEPEDIVTVPATANTNAAAIGSNIVSRQEARANAETLRLRLRLATYKVRTNQTEVPLSRLKVTTSNSPNLSQHRVADWTRDDTYTVSELPRLKAEDDSIDIPSSPPVPVSSSYRGPREVDSFQSPAKRPGHPLQHMVTPNLPKKKDTSLHPNAAGGFESPDFQRRGSTAQDLTSSVIKGRAADGLLSLMSAYR